LPNPIAALKSDGRVPALERQIVALQSEVGSMRERHGAEIGHLAEENRALAELTSKMSQSLAVLQHQLASIRSEIIRMQGGDAAEKAAGSDEDLESSSSSEDDEEDEERAAGAKDGAQRQARSDGNSHSTDESESENSESSSSEATSESEWT
jgi:hypothetical protein